MNNTVLLITMSFAVRPFTAEAATPEEMERCRPKFAKYAALTVEPTPDTVIRLFMVFRGSDRPVRVGSPALPARERRGFTVVEWGGAELDVR